MVLIDGTVAVAATRVRQVAAHGPLEERLAAFTGELAVVLSGALVATDDALHVLLIALHVQARVAAAARTLGAVGLRVWCHAVVLLLQFLLRHHGRRGRDEGAQRGELLVRGDAGAHRRQVSRPGTVRGRRLGHERHASREVQVEGTEFTLATRVEETCGGWGRSLAKGAPEMRIVGDNSGGIGPRDGASSVGVGLQEGSFGGLRRGEYSNHRDTWLWRGSVSRSARGHWVDTSQLIARNRETHRHNYLALVGDIHDALCAHQITGFY